MPAPSYRGPNTHLRALWGPPLYATAMGSVEVTPPPEPPYRRLYHLLSAGFATSNIALQRMKVARWSDLNDRFELNPCVGASSHDHRWFKDVDEHEGLLCFSRDWTNGMLWSTYAEKHRGIALGFDVDTKATPPHDVSYTGERLRPPFEPIKARTTKAADWAYEAEVRVFVKLRSTENEGGLHFMPFGKSLRLREVILGPECSQSLDSTRRLVDKVSPGVVVIQARRAANHFKVVPREATVPPWPA